MSTRSTSSRLVGLLLAAAFGSGLLLRRRRARREARGLEARIRAVESELARSSRRRDHLVAAIAHELRTPLSAIVGYQELLADGLYGSVDRGAREAIDRASRAAGAAIRLVNGLESLAGRAGEWSRLRPQLAAPEEILARVAADARVAAAERGVAPEIRLSAPLPCMTTDPDHLALAVGIALDAALRASPGGTLRIDARASGNQDLVVEVAGIRLSRGLQRPLDALDEPGESRWDPDEGIPGITLQLSIALRFARLLGGDLVLEPEGDTTTLRFHVPELRSHRESTPATPP